MASKPLTVTQKLIKSHLIDGQMVPGEEIALKIDQTLTQDATGTAVMLELESMDLEKTKAELSVQYIDHNMLQTDFKNPDDHRFLLSAARRFGLWYSRPGNGISHAVHMERFGIPGKTLIGSDSHTTAGGSLGMLAIGAGGLEVALAIAGEPLYIKMPEVWGVKLVGTLTDWVSAKDIILEMLRRHDVKGGVGKIIEYYGPGLENLSAMDRHVLANMGTELGATTSVFPSDLRIKHFLETQGRGDKWIPLVSDNGSDYDLHEEINLSTLEPLIAKPSSPGNVVPVADEVGKDIYQAYPGSSANPGFRDFAIPAMMLEGQKVHPDISFDINPSTRQVLDNLLEYGYLKSYVRAGGRIHEPGCGGCIGMGQAPATGQWSIRTVPRNFPGRSGTVGDKVYLSSPETSTASALTGVITDPRTLGFKYPKYMPPKQLIINTTLLISPSPDGKSYPLIKEPNIQSLPPLDPIPDHLNLPVLLKVGDNISTDEIMPAGAKILPLRSNIPEISKYVFSRVDESYYTRAMESKQIGHVIIGGENYGQGLSREHAAIAPRYLGLRVVIVKSFARIHWQNLINFGILPLTFKDPQDYEKIEINDQLLIENLHQQLIQGTNIAILNKTKEAMYSTVHSMSNRQIEAILAGSLLSLFRSK